MLKRLKKGSSSRPFFQISFQSIRSNKRISYQMNWTSDFLSSPVKKGVWKLGIVFEQLIKMAKLHIMVVNSMLLTPQWHGLNSRNWQFLKFLK